MMEFMLRIMNRAERQAGWTDERKRMFLKSCEEYIGGLKKEGKLVGAQPLVREGVIISGSGEDLIETPFVPRGEVQVGYYHIKAVSLDEAVAIAKRNPEFRFSETARIEVRPIKTKEKDTGFVYPEGGEFMKKPITIEALIKAPVEKVWGFWTAPEHIMRWNNASDDWHTPRAENDLRPGGKFLSRMEAKDGSAGFDFVGTYDEVKKNELIAYTMGDGRKVKVVFANDRSGTKVVETFDPEDTNPVEMQRGGWQAILNNFKKYVESNPK
jgi:uncharacterized protein YndB with AHSA1/START domain